MPNSALVHEQRESLMEERSWDHDFRFIVTKEADLPPPTCLLGERGYQETIPGHLFPYHHLNKNSSENPGTFTYYCCQYKLVQAFWKAVGKSHQEQPSLNTRWSRALILFLGTKPRKIIQTVENLCAQDVHCGIWCNSISGKQSKYSSIGKYGTYTQ